jgi:hypothetical protein
MQTKIGSTLFELANGDIADQDTDAVVRRSLEVARRRWH